MLEKIFKKLNQIPSWVSIVVLVVACVVANVPNLLNFDSYMQMITESIQELSPSPVQVNVTPGFKYVAVAIMVVFSYLIIELVARLMYGWASRSRYTNRGKKYLLTSVRYGMAVVHLVHGLYSLLSVYAPEVYSYSGEAVLFLLRTAIITLVFLGIRKECINDKFVFTLYNRLYGIYFIYNGALYLLDLLSTVLIAPIDVPYAIYCAIMLAVVGISAGVLYLIMFKKLKKEQEDARKILIIPPISGNGRGGDDSEIFNGYGM